MLRCVVAFILIAGVVSCAKAPESSAGPPGAAAREAKAASVNTTLAYEHSLTIETEDAKITPLFEAAQAACRDAVDASCAILAANLSRGERSQATLRFRARSDGIKQLVALFAAQGEVANQSTDAEDLGGPIQDTEQRLALLTDYRGQLEGLRTRSGVDMDNLMRLTREIADVQSQIESLAGNQAQLLRRVRTEILTVTIVSHATQAFWSPVAHSLSEFGDDFAQTLAVAITLVAYLLPWLLVGLLVAWVVRRIRKSRVRHP